jgi:hypothetical protein
LEKYLFPHSIYTAGSAYIRFSRFDPSLLSIFQVEEPAFFQFTRIFGYSRIQSSKKESKEGSKIFGNELEKLQNESKPCPSDQMVWQDPEKKNVDNTMQDSNKRQASRFVEQDSHDKPNKTGIKDFVECTVP